MIRNHPGRIPYYFEIDKLNEIDTQPVGQGFPRLVVKLILISNKK